MKPVIILIMGVALLQGATGFAAGEKDDAGLARILEIRRETAFAGQFSRLLLTIEPAALPAFRASLREGFAAKKFSNRHARRAIGLTETRWAETDTPGFIAACKGGLKDPSTEGTLRAAVLLLEKDPEEAIPVARELNLEKLGVLNSFMLRLVSRDPARALAFYKEEMQRGRTMLLPQPMLARWATFDPQGAWNALAAFPDPHQQMRAFRTVVAGGAARVDSASALRLIDSLANPAERSTAQVDLVTAMAAENVPLALELCRAINTNAAWKGFAENLRARTDEETIRILLTSLPDEHRGEGLRAFFARDGYPTEPAFPNARMLPRIEDAALRREMIVAIAGAKISKNHLALPASVLDAALAMPDELLSGQTPQPVRELLVEQLLRHDPLLLLPWLMALREAEWENYRRSLARNWPQHHLPRDIPALFAETRPRAKLIGKELAEKWLEDDPVRAFPIVVAHAPELLTRWFKYETILAARKGDAKQVEAELATIPEAKAREVARFAFLEWRVRNLPPETAAALVTERLRDWPDQTHRNTLLSALAIRLEEEMDKLLGTIPGVTAEEMDEIRSIRASNLLSAGHEARAFRFWREISADQKFFSSVESYYRTRYFTSSSEGHPTDWVALLDMIAARPGAEKQSDLIEGHAKKLLKDKPEEARRIAGGIRKGPFADQFLAALRRLSPEAKGELTWANAVELGLHTSEGRRIGLIAITRIAEEDPKAALAMLIETGGAAMAPEFIQTVMRGMLPSDPAASFAVIQHLPAQQAAPLLSEVTREWVKSDPRAACEACLAMQSARKPYLLRETLDAWARIDAPAARAWTLALPRGDDRGTAMNGLVLRETTTSPAKAAALALEEFADELEPDLARSIAKALANGSYEQACRFMLELDGKTAAIDLREAWATTTTAWLRSDPTSARAFLQGLPPTPHAAMLVSQNADKPASSSVQSGPRPVMDEKHRPVEELLAGRYENQTLNPEEFKVLRDLVVSSSEPRPDAKDALSALCQYMIRQEMDGDIAAVLAESVKGKSPDLVPGYVTPKIKECIEKYRFVDPENLDAFLDGLATFSPVWLDIAVTAMWEGTGPFLDPDARINPVYALALARLPAQRRAEILLRSIQGRSILPFELADTILHPDRQAYRLDPLARVVHALAQDKLDEALQAALNLPPSDGDPLVRLILDGFDNPRSAEQAISTIKDPRHSERARAWFELLGVTAK